VWFCVLATANHFWVDVLAGIVVALVSVWIVGRVTRRRERPAQDAPIANLL
jgi:membrane-associated phospholipid phosphatase